MRLIVYFDSNMFCFLTTGTANKAVETNEMWRVRKKEIELEDERHKGKTQEESSSSQMKQNGSFMKRSLDKRCSSGDEKMSTCASSNKRWYTEDDEGLGDDDIETFLQSRYVLSHST